MKNIYETSPFATFFPSEKEVKSKAKYTLSLRVYAPTARPSQRLYIVGSSEVLGCWDAEKAVPLTLSSYPYWTVALDLSKLGDEFEYKFIIKENGSTWWEDGYNRRYYVCGEMESEHIDATFRGNFDWKGAGVAIPVFSLRTEQSQGVGDFVDLKKMGEWAVATGQKIIQILPINDTTQTFSWRDSYPYSAISIFALNPMYLSIRELGAEGEELDRLNSLEFCDYDAVVKMKFDFIRKAFAKSGKRTLGTKAFAKFYEANKDWLDKYAAFCYLRDKNGTANFQAWGKDATYSTKLVEKLIDPSFKEYNKVAIYFWLQYQLDRQLKESVAYCRSLGVVLKGDIPIGISRDSVEAWSDARLFNMNCQAGAPPDDFSADGQNWGFPTYNWEVMAQDGYAWWKRRFEKMADYFDLYRIDHILGFFRIWEIPMDSIVGLLGYFNPAMPYSYDELAQRGMPMNRERYVEPQIHWDYLGEYFCGEDWTPYLDAKDNGYFSLKPEYRTQRQILEALGDKNDKVKNALYGLTGEVLFIEDPRKPGHFHPRISAQHTKSYQWLSNWEKERFNELYNDFFYRRHNDFWGALAMEKLPALVDATNMMCCGEDLGMVPACVGPVMQNLGILSLEVQRMPKDPEDKFGYTNRYPYASVCTTGSHDTSTIRGWWREDWATTQAYYNEILWKQGNAPADASGEICRTIVNNHLLSPSALTILPLQDWLSIDESVRKADADSERINIPAIANHYWRYRMHLTVEELLTKESLNEQIKGMVESSGR
ncbi:MAG: 4-alpha-glucanotransferase [Tidjanibacter sp.]|nr:4-alpha-glucanotransferase [Tidjanibacter sp.]